MKTSRVAILTGLFALSLAGPVRAAFNYQYAFDRASYAVAAGGTINVQVFLKETVSGIDVSRLATDGLIGAGARVRFDVAPVPGAPAQVLSLADIQPNTAAFDAQALLTRSLVSGASAGFSEAVDVLSPPVFGTLISPNTYEVLLGTFRFTAGSVPGQVTNLLATDFSPATSDTITGAGLTLDPSILNGSATINVSAIPEPGSLALLGTGLSGVVALLRRKSGRPS